MTATGHNLLFRNGTADCAENINNIRQLEIDSGNSNIVFTNVSFDGNALASPSSIWQTYQGSCSIASGLTCNSMEALKGSGTFECDYCSVVNYAKGRPLQYLGSLPYIFKYSWISGCCMSDPTSHNELLEYAATGGPGTGSITQLGNTINITTAHQDVGLSLWPTNFGSNTVVSTIDEENNFVIIGWSGAATFPGGGTGGTVSGSVSGDVFTVGAITPSGATVGNGPVISCIPPATFTGTIDNGSGTGTPAGDVLTVTSPPTNSIPLVPGTAISGSGVTGGPNIVAQISGTAGGIGTYTLDVATNARTSTTLTGANGNGTGGVGLSFTMVYDGLSGTTSAGPGGGGNGGPGSEWHMDLNSTLSFTGYIDDGVGPGYDGNPGNVLTVTFDEAVDLSAVNMTVNGLTLTPIAGATGVGQYTVSGSASTVSPGVFTAVPGVHQRLRTGFGAPPGATAALCLAQAYGVTPWTHAIADDFSPMINQADREGNYVDLSGYGTDNDLWSQRTGAISFTGTITGGTALVTSGLVGSLGANDLVLPTSLVSSDTFIVSGTAPNWSDLTITS